MLSTNMNQSGYTSCIKIFGVPILPPLITEERRKELNDDKQRAIEIEKKLKGKRSSIDSGVMTGSYIEHFRNNDLQQKEEPSAIEYGIWKEDFVHLSANAELNYVSDSFLKTALEDPQFREFFSATAEKIFKDNINNNIEPTNVDSNSNETQRLSNIEDELQSLDFLSELSIFAKPSESIDYRSSDTKSQVPSVVESDVTLKCLEKTRIIDSEMSNKPPSHSPPPPGRVRRNSYTLESPSPVLLEHLAKELESGKESVKWQTLSNEKESDKGPGFKTFFNKNQRKHWERKMCDHSSIVRVENQRTMFTLGRSITFVKPEKKVGESNYSLPCSSHTSPLLRGPLARSVDCIKSMEVNTLCEFNKEQISNLNPETVNEIDAHTVPCGNSKSCAESETSIVFVDGEKQSVSVETSPTSLINNASGSEHSNCSINNSPPQIESSDSVSQMSAVIQSAYLQQNSMCNRNTDDESVFKNINHTVDFDDIASLCSSMSISKFLPTNETSRPSTAEEVSEANICLLKMKHENELKDLLEKQRLEEEMFSQLLSARGSVTSRTTTNFSSVDPLDSSSEVYFMDKRECSRELFPTQQSSIGTYTNKLNDYSDKEKIAATKLTAFAKGYLTRRLLKTEKVQQLIELIKESLSCAFSLQLEPHLKPTDLELHARLAHQLTKALQELQEIVSAPVASRMAIIAADRERLRRPASRPSSTISLATRKSLMRRQQSLNSSEKKSRESRGRTKSFSANSISGSLSSGSRVRSDSASTISTSSSRLPWR